MKALTLALIALVVPFAAQAERIKSEKAELNVARITGITQLSSKDSDTLVNLVVHDRGGSTDLSPTQEIYLTIYRKGEMFSTDAAFKIDSIFFLQSAKRRADGRIEVKAMGFRGENEYFTPVTYVIDARAAAKKVEGVECGDEFDCNDSENFAAEISVIKK